MQQAIMLRAINIGPNRRVPMADLRALLSEAGYDHVRTYVQSGNVVLESTQKPAELERETAALISERFGFDVPVVVRTGRQLAAVVRLNPLGSVVSAPKLHQVTFLAQKPPAAAVHALEQAAVGEERVVCHGREIYSWHPDGVARSKLATGLAGKKLGTATARNWTTVTALLEMTGG